MPAGTGDRVASVGTRPPGARLVTDPYPAAGGGPGSDPVRLGLVESLRGRRSGVAVLGAARNGGRRAEAGCRASGPAGDGRRGHGRGPATSGQLEQRIDTQVSQSSAFPHPLAIDNMRNLGIAASDWGARAGSRQPRTQPATVSTRPKRRFVLRSGTRLPSNPAVSLLRYRAGRSNGRRIFPLEASVAPSFAGKDTAQRISNLY